MILFQPPPISVKSVDAGKDDPKLLTGNKDIHAFPVRFKTGNHIIRNMLQSVHAHIVIQGTISSRYGNKRIVKGSVNMNGSILVSGLFMNVQILTQFLIILILIVFMLLALVFP